MGDASYQVREFHNVHTCAPEHKVKQCTSLYIANKYEDSFITDPTRSVKRFMKDACQGNQVKLFKTTSL